ncbi:hypothetical protein [uncultured Draconibacterium sp.]|uniref:hypothetical protein n=1 Tax=uncultured Draconibacterium sp. TaxID=1573823 RepID=UPI0029C6B11A|nr:hypothetical protein [uncultured Draconibacterium sp.]
MEISDKVKKEIRDRVKFIQDYFTRVEKELTNSIKAQQDVNEFLKEKGLLQEFRKWRMNRHLNRQSKKN